MNEPEFCVLKYKMYKCVDNNMLTNVQKDLQVLVDEIVWGADRSRFT